MEYGTQVLELLTEINETSAISAKSRRVCSLIRRSRRRKVHRLSLGRCVTTADMHAEPKFPKMSKDVIKAEACEACVACSLHSLQNIRSLRMKPAKPAKAGWLVDPIYCE